MSRTELVRDFGHRKVSALVSADSEVAQSIFDLASPGAHTPASWNGVLEELDSEQQRLDHWLQE